MEQFPYNVWQIENLNQPFEILTLVFELLFLHFATTKQKKEQIYLFNFV